MHQIVLFSVLAHAPNRVFFFRILHLTLQLWRFPAPCITMYVCLLRPLDFALKNLPKVLVLQMLLQIVFFLLIAICVYLVHPKKNILFQQDDFY